MPIDQRAYNRYTQFSLTYAWRAICMAQWAHFQSGNYDAAYARVLNLTSVQNLLPTDPLVPNTLVVRSNSGTEIAFEGTTSAPQWLSYITQAGTTVVPGLGVVTFKPFEDWSRAIYSVLRPTLQLSEQIVLYGHSLGGAMACLIGLKLLADGYDVRAVYTGGCPRVFDSRSASVFGCPAHHVFRNGDMIPSLPFPTTQLQFSGDSPPGFISPIFRPGFDHLVQAQTSNLMFGLQQLRSISNPFAILNTPLALFRTHLMPAYLQAIWYRMHDWQRQIVRDWYHIVLHDFEVELFPPLAA